MVGSCGRGLGGGPVYWGAPTLGWGGGGSRRLHKARLGSTPAVLFSERYEDLSITALGREKQVQARRFAGASPGGSPAQKRYEKLRRVLRELYDGAAPGRR